MSDKRFGLPRERILRGRDALAGLFEHGESRRFGPLLIRWHHADTAESEAVTRTAFITPKRIGRSVDRSRVRRLLRESFRRRRPEFEEELPEGLSLEIGLIWLHGKPLPDFAKIDRQVERSLRHVLEKVCTRENTP